MEGVVTLHEVVPHGGGGVVGLEDDVEDSVLEATGYVVDARWTGL